MKLLRIGIAMAGIFAALIPISAQTTPSTAEREAAYAAFSKLRNDRTAKMDQAQFARVAAVGFEFLTKYPASTRSNSVVTSLASYGGTGNANAVNRKAWIAYMKFEMLDQKAKEGLSADAVTGLAALDTALAGALAREDRSRENVMAFRERLDALTKMPGADRYLSTQERVFGELMATSGRPEQAEAFYKALLQHPDKNVVAMATTELGLIEARRTAYTASFTGIDGKPIDFGQMRNKVVLIAFWSPASETSGNQQVALKELYSQLRKKGFEIVGVACAKESERGKVEAFVKSKKLPWPTYFDGKEFNGDIARKFNIRSVPAGAVLNKEGHLVSTPTSAFDREVKRVMGVK